MGIGFLEWIGLKQKLHHGTQSPPLVSAGDIWWAPIGENVGSEINGKSRLFSRPVIIFKKTRPRLLLRDTHDNEVEDMVRGVPAG